jgi:hypothetical protein
VGNSASGILFGLIGFNMILMLLLQMSYPIPAGTPNPLCDLAPLGLGAGCTSSPFNPGTQSGTTNNPNNPDQIQQSQAVNEVCGVSAAGGAIGGAIIGTFIEPGLGTIIGAVIGGLVVGGSGCYWASNNPAGSVGLANQLSSVPILGQLGDTAATFGLMMRYIGIMTKYFPDTLVYISAITFQEPAAGAFVIVLNGLAGVWFAYSLVKLIRGTGG